MVTNVECAETAESALLTVWCEDGSAHAWRVGGRVARKLALAVEAEEHERTRLPEVQEDEVAEGDFYEDGRW